MITNMIREGNKQDGLSPDLFVVDYLTYIAAFKEASPYRDRLMSHPDEVVKRELESINEKLRKFNEEHHYPSDWVSAIPQPPAQ
jgi:hypothetical protein